MPCFDFFCINCGHVKEDEIFPINKEPKIGEKVILEPCERCGKKKFMRTGVHVNADRTSRWREQCR